MRKEAGVRVDVLAVTSLVGASAAVGRARQAMGGGCSSSRLPDLSPPENIGFTKDRLGRCTSSCWLLNNNLL